MLQFKYVLTFLNEVLHFVTDICTTVTNFLPFMFMAFLWSICLVNIETHFHFQCRTTCLHVTCTTDDVFLLSQIWLVTTFSVVGTTEFYCMSPDPCSDSGYKTNTSTTCTTCLTNHMGFISCHMTPLVINSLGVDTHVMYNTCLCRVLVLYGTTFTTNFHLLEAT